MTRIVVNRQYSVYDSTDPVVKRVLHGFSDASEMAYGCCIYMKSIKKSGDCDVTLIAAKSRVVPLSKKYSIPKLALLGNYILSKLITVVSDSLQKETEIHDYRCWTDSMITLAWIKATDKELKTFCQSRVVKIRKQTDVNKWFHCRSEENPADIITRFDNQPDLATNHIWWNASEFIHDNKAEQRDDSPEALYSKEYLEEVKPLTSVLITIQKEEEVKINIKNIVSIEKYNDVNKLYRITALVLRFVRNLRKKKNNNTLNIHKYVTITELREAKHIWLIDNQRELRKEDKFDQLKNNLKLEEDGDDLLRSKKRLMNANLPYSTRAPIILCRNHRLSELIVLEKHTLVKHNGERQTLAEVRRNYWISRGKSFVKHVLLPCRKCKEYNSRPYSYPETPNLPHLRLRDDVPFSGTGVDYFGPLYCRDIFAKNSQMYKCWVVLYTCASTRGVILDVVHSNHSQTFINSFRRFIARRGCPVTVLSDNGKSFIAENTQSFVAMKNVDWKFNIESAPWYGGFWERLVQSVKRCIKKTLSKSKLSYEELQTVLLEIELVINSRPLCSLFDDDQVEVITPNQLLFGRN